MAKHNGVKITGYITSDFPIEDIDNSEFLDKFIEWIEANGYQFCGSCIKYEYETGEKENEEVCEN